MQAEDSTGHTQRRGFSADLFKFSVDRPWDGKDGAGGWQKASTTLKFVDGRHFIPRSWTCPVTVGMPLQTRGDGSISAVWAAATSAGIATDASVNVVHRKTEWIGAEYCIEFYKEMNDLFKARHETLGARVSRL